jgi:hypothetical protein
MAGLQQSSDVSPNNEAQGMGGIATPKRAQGLPGQKHISYGAWMDRQ